MEPDGAELLRVRRDTPRHDYAGCTAVIKQMVDEIEQRLDRTGSLGIGIRRLQRRARRSLALAMMLINPEDLA